MDSAKYSTRARKRFGQHFLVDERAVQRIVERLAPRTGEAVLEIGPGRGALTGPLIDAVGRIAAVELDRDLARELRERFDERQLLLVCDDVLRLELAALRRTLAGSRAPRLVVAGNLPYNISKPIAMKLVRERRQVERAVLMFQREVARRLTAPPGGRDYGPLGVLARAAFDIEVAFDLPPGAFRPAPKVESSVTVWRALPPESLTGDEERRLRFCLAVCFRRRRRTLLGNLSDALGDRSRAAALLAAAAIDPALRAERVTPAGFRRLAELWPGDTDALV